MADTQDDVQPVTAALPRLQLPRLTPSHLHRGRAYSPRKLIWTLDDEDWEQLVYEWARLLPGYSLVRRFTGSGDAGRDVVAFVGDADLFAEWDCYQCKHYGLTLSPSDAWPEIFKILDAVARGKFALPRKYYFVAPRETGPALKSYFADSASFLNDFQQAAQSAKYITEHYSHERIGAVLKFADAEVMKRFDYVPIVDMLETLKGTPVYLSWFGGGLPVRPPHEPPPMNVAPTELVYVAKLLDVYNEEPASAVYKAASEIEANSATARHLQRQREAFYSAEALGKFARDVSPDGTFELLQQEVFDSVIECHDGLHMSARSRLDKVLDAALAAQITSSPLISEVRQTDRKGICHQLANDDLLTWVRST